MNGLCSTDFIDADDQGFDLFVFLQRAEVERNQAERDDETADERDLQIRLHDQRRAEELAYWRLASLSGGGSNQAAGVASDVSDDLSIATCLARAR